MGRLKRYKKIKSFDPFAKKSKAALPVVGKVTKYELSPDEIENKRKKRDKKARGLDLNNEDDLEKFYQQEALKDLEMAKNAESIEKKLKKIEDKRDDETQREFKMRLRQETRETLRDEFKKSSSTAMKRKERLKIRKMKRDGKRVNSKRSGGGDGDDDDDDNEVDPNEDFDAIERDFLRNKAEIRELEAAALSIKGTKAENLARSHPFLGSTDNNVTAPPDLTLFKIKMKGAPKTIDLKTAVGGQEDGNNNSSNLYQKPKQGNNYPAPTIVKLSKNQQKKENRLKLESMISSDSLDEHRQNGLMSIMSYSGSGISTASFRGKGTSNKDSLRIDAINAYRDLKQKKRQAFSEY
jgi:hypothetical protein